VFENDCFVIDSGPTPRSSSSSIFRISLLICVAVALWGIISPDHLASSSAIVTKTAFRALDWFFMASVSAFVLLLLGLALSRHGELRLATAGEEPEFSTASWLAMLFAAGMGVGLLFWGVAEPISHFTQAPNAAPRTEAAAARAMVYTCFHWGLHAWAVYAIAALVLAYFGFVKRQPYLPGAPLRAAFSGRWVGGLS